MKIVVDENIAFAEEAFGGFGELRLLPGRSIKNQDLLDAEILIIRSVTEVNESLLGGSKIKFVGTATIGMDHLDENYLRSADIKYAGAAGCNSFAVTEYVLSALSHLAHFNDLKLSGKSIGIIGMGNIGGKVAHAASIMGLKALKNDPPLERIGFEDEFCSLEKALSADIVTFHVPLNLEGRDKTVHMLNEENIHLIKPGAILINTSRGPVVDNSVLLNRLKLKNDIFTVLDVWENEPQINRELLKRVNIATPHIAGYSLEGKANGTKIIYNKLCEFLSAEPEWIPSLPSVKSDIVVNPKDDFEKIMYSIMASVYNIAEDSLNLKRAAVLPPKEIPVLFDTLRKKYPLPGELDKYKTKFTQPDNELVSKLCALRLSVCE